MLIKAPDDMPMSRRLEIIKEADKLAHEAFTASKATEAGQNAIDAYNGHLIEAYGLARGEG